ncbi:alpha/beta fold hydrolase [Peribacillus muralis]|uniref:alpha/beta fold hydrolase n=1 Tax=Peribacillus muralis TaxID=264697 RepID=UPI000709CD69|nr:alpha/beta hydrolase [Peribacillus muralis]
MALFEVEEGVRLYYEEEGQGRPIIFIHGVWMSSRFFAKQLPYFSRKYKTILLDLRSHGRSNHVHHGNTVSVYAKDLHAFISKRGLKDVILVGWSMGAFIVWDYLKQFGEGNVHSTVIVDELASDFKWPDFDIGAFDIGTLIAFMTEIQTNRTPFLRTFLSSMFKNELSEEDVNWMLEEVTKMPESIASSILFDQSIVDYREFLPNITVPTLLCFGREEKVIPVAAGEHLHDNITDSQLVIFENSCHCPFLEESDLFNKTVNDFIQKETDDGMEGAKNP